MEKSTAGLVKKTTFLLTMSEQPFKINWNGFHRVQQNNDSGAVFIELLNILCELVQAYYTKNHDCLGHLLLFFCDNYVKYETFLVFLSLLCLAH